MGSEIESNEAVIGNVDTILGIKKEENGTDTSKID